MERSPPRRRLRWWIGIAYLAALIASQFWIATRPDPAAYTPAGSERVTLPAQSSSLSALHWKGQVDQGSPSRDGARLPILLLHGSPGEAADLADLAARLAGAGREVISLDLPGFGGSASAPGSRSIESHAKSALACSPWQEFHVAGWSMGGGVALHMAELAPQRVRSLCLIASIGVQEAEGSGNYYFEHLKYALSWLLLVPGAELIPHFGVLGARSRRSGLCLNFWQSDQRPLRRILSTLSTPLTIAHGRSDFLVPLWCAQESHTLARASRLVVFEASHFLPFDPPFGQLDRLAPELEAFLGRHETAGTPEPRASFEFSSKLGHGLPEPYWLARQVPWWLAFAALGLLARARPLWCGLAIGGLCGLLQLDLGLGLCAALFGVSWRALRSPQGSLKSWCLDLARILGACVVVSVFAVWAKPRLCALAGPRVGALLTLALPFLAALAALRCPGMLRRLLPVRYRAPVSGR